MHVTTFNAGTPLFIVNMIRGRPEQLWKYDMSTFSTLVLCHAPSSDLCHVLSQQIHSPTT